MTNTNTNTADVLNHAIDKAGEGLAQVAHALSNAAPQAWALAVHGTYAQGVASLVTGGMLLVVAVILGLFSWCCVSKMMRIVEAKDKAYYNDEEVPCAIAGFFFGLGCFILMCVSLCNICDSDNWVKVISPDGYLAQQVLSKAL